MDLYNDTSFELSRRLTHRYSTSFSLSSRLFPSRMRRHIHAIYGLVRIADEIVDTYKGTDARNVLDELEQHTEEAMKRGYSPNPIVQAFVATAAALSIDTELLQPFFASMRMDLLPPKPYTTKRYQEYIYGSAEVVGLMCLKVFVNGDASKYERLAPGAQSLGAAYQKVNFLRDMYDDHNRLGRVYFPEVDFATFSDDQKKEIEADIMRDFEAARKAIDQLPRSVRLAVRLSYDFYLALLKKIIRTDAVTLQRSRVRISNGQKALLFMRRVVLR